MSMLGKLRKLGFSKAIQAYSIDKTIEVMHDEIDANLDLSCAVLTEMEDDFAPYSVTKENHAMKLQDWVEDHANAIHKRTDAENHLSIQSHRAAPVSLNRS